MVAAQGSVLLEFTYGGFYLHGACPCREVEREGGTRLSEADHLKAALPPRVIVPVKDPGIGPLRAGRGCDEGEMRLLELGRPRAVEDKRSKKNKASAPEVERLDFVGKMFLPLVRQ